MVGRVTISEKHVAIVLRADASNVAQKLEHANLCEIEDGIELSIGIRLKHRQTAILIEAPGSSSRLLASIVRSCEPCVWREPGPDCSPRAMSPRFVISPFDMAFAITTRSGCCRLPSSRPTWQRQSLTANSPRPSRSVLWSSKRSPWSGTSSSRCLRRSASTDPVRCGTGAHCDCASCYLTETAPVIGLLQPCSAPDYLGEFWPRLVRWMIDKSPVSLAFSISVACCLRTLCGETPVIRPKTGKRTLLETAQRNPLEASPVLGDLAATEALARLSSRANVRKSPEIEGWESDTCTVARLAGGRDRDRTCDPYHVKRGIGPSLLYTKIH